MNISVLGEVPLGFIEARSVYNSNNNPHRALQNDSEYTHITSITSGDRMQTLS